MTRSAKAAAEAHAAADALSAWLGRERLWARAVPAQSVTGQAEKDRVEIDDEAWFSNMIRALDDVQRSATTAAPRPSVDQGKTFHLPNPDWLHHRLSVSGPQQDLATFQDAAAGAGIIPWHYDLDRMETDFFHLLVAPPPRELSLTGAKMLARQLRDAVGRRHDLAGSRVGQSRACPFDLHALVPIPLEILALGPDEPEALAWLWAHWGTTQPLRHVAAGTVGDPAGGGKQDGAALRLTFWSADWTPWRALENIAGRWPMLQFQVRPTYDPK